MNLIDMSHLELIESHLQVNDKLQGAEHDRDALIEKCKRLKENLEGYSQMANKLQDAERDRDALIEKCKAQLIKIEDLRVSLSHQTARVMALKRGQR